MAEKQVYVEFTSLTPSTLIFPTLFTPRAYVDKKRPGSAPGKPQFSTQFGYTLTHADMGRFNAAMRDAATQMWGSDKQAQNDKGMLVDILYPYELGSAIADAAKRENKDREAFRPLICIKASTGEDKPVGLAVMRDGISMDVPQSGPDRAEFGKFFFGGADVQFILNLHPMYSFGHPYVKAYLQYIRALGTGEPVKAFSAGGTKSASSAFGAGPAAATHTGHVSNVNPLG